jgi:hypothetical protein
MVNKWTFVSSLIFAGHTIGIWIKATRNPENPAKFLFETKTEEMSQEEITKAREEHGIDYIFKSE